MDSLSADILPGFHIPSACDIMAQGAMVGFSGGVDSVVLLHLIHCLYGKRLTLVHVNHGLRGGHSEGDAEFCRHVADQYGLPIIIKSGDVGQLAKSRGVSVELAARQFRYKCFEQAAQEANSRFLFLAHHANDQAETVLFNLCRGAGGAKGMRAISLEHNPILVRPMIRCLKQDIVSYAVSRQLPWREDHTNLLPIAVRNEIRAEVVPALERIMQRDIVSKIAEAAEIEEGRTDALEMAIERLNLMDPQGRLYLPGVVNLPEALKKAVIHWFLCRKKINGITHRLIEEVLLLISDPSVSKINAPGGRFIRRKEKRLFVD